VTAESAYDTYAPKLTALGLIPLPVGPGTKQPQSWVPSEGCFKDLPSWNHERFRPRTTPQPGAGIAVRCGLQPNGKWLVALDLDSEDVALAAIEAFPSLGLTKAGQRGFTALYQSPAAVVSRDYRIGDETVVQVLSDGKLTVLPPTVHPSTQKPYTWTCTGTLYDVINFDSLPEWPANGIELIEGLLKPLGWEPEPERPPTNGHDGEGGPCSELNAKALENLPSWVPDLGLENCHRQRGRFCSYRAKASYREGEREDSLLFASKGIKDFGSGESFTPLNIVMRVLDLDLTGAFAWLKERVEPKTADVDVDFEALGATKAKVDGGAEAKTEGDGETKEEAKEKKEPKYRFKIVRFKDMRPGAAEQPYLIFELIPAKGLVVVWGPPKCYKSFWLHDAMLHVAKGWEYHDRFVMQGAVVYCAFEGGHGHQKRVEAERRHYGLADDDDPPLYTISGQANLIKDHKLLVSEIRGQLAKGDVLRAVILDTLNRSLDGSESKDVDMAAYTKAAEAVRNAFDCVVIIVHHCGWDPTRPRGHSSLPAAVDAELAVVREENVATITVKYMRDGPEEIQVVVRSKIVEVGTDASGRPMTSLVMLRQEGTAEGDDPLPKARKWPPSLRVFRAALAEALLDHGFDYKIPDGPTVRAADLEDVRATFYRTYLVTGDEGTDREQLQNSKRKAFGRAVEWAQRGNLIAARVDGQRQAVWFTSPFEK
jgi:hypothetical protein